MGVLIYVSEPLAMHHWCHWCTEQGVWKFINWKQAIINRQGAVKHEFHVSVNSYCKFSYNEYHMYTGISCYLMVCYSIYCFYDRFEFIPLMLSDVDPHLYSGHNRNVPTFLYIIILKSTICICFIAFLCVLLVFRHILVVFQHHFKPQAWMWLVYWNKRHPF